MLSVFILQAHAASAILNFSENCTPDILTPYLDGVVSKLLVLLQVRCHIWFEATFSVPSLCQGWVVILRLCIIQNGKQMVQEGALTALASVADSSQVLCEDLIMQVPFGLKMTRL